MTTPNPGKEQQSEDVLFSLREILSYLSEYIKGVIDLKKGVDAQATIDDIINKSSLEGANAWMLMCSIVIASIGLSQDSQAVIIGAMLISPLMSPILGIGLSVGINDMEALTTSLTHFTIAIVIALLSSYIYFSITPFDGLTSEISRRTLPTFLDIFIAIFGGLAGIISIARKDISTTIPGVAIATALMPPLCVTGYGLAKGNWEITSAAFYLFFLNTFFVALATYLIVRFLKFPYRQFINKKSYRNNMVLIIAFSLTLVVPSFFIFRNVIKTQQFNNNLETFVNDCLGEKKIYLDGYNTANDSLGQATLYLKVYGNAISIDDKEDYLNCLNQCGISDHNLQIISTSDVDIDDMEILRQNLKSIATELGNNKAAELKSIRLINYYQQVHIDSSSFTQIKNEVKGLFPDLLEFGYAYTHMTDFDSSRYDLPTVMVKWDNIRASIITEQNETLKNFLVTRMQIDTPKVIQY